MKIETTRFGSQEIEKDALLHFPNGLSGNSQAKDFKLFHKEESEADPIVFWLQSTEDPNIAYAIIDPSLVGFSYEVSLPDEDYSLLESSGADEIAMMVIITEGENTIQDGMSLISGSVTDPLFINLNSQKGLQRSIKNLDYDIFLNIPVVNTGK